MPDLGVSHQAGREAHGFAGGLEQRPRFLGDPAIEHRLARPSDGVALGGRRPPPSVADQENDGSPLQAGTAPAASVFSGRRAVDAPPEVRDDVPKRHVGVVGGLEVAGLLTSGVACAQRHRFEMVRARQAPEVLVELRGGPGLEPALQGRQLGQGILLHLVALPAGSRCGRQRLRRCEAAEGLRGGQEFRVWPEQHAVDPRLEKLEDAAFPRVREAEKGEVERKAEDLSRGGGDPGVEHRGRERPVFPAAVGKPDRDVIGQAIIPHQRCHAPGGPGAVDTAPRGPRGQRRARNQDSDEAVGLGKGAQSLYVPWLLSAEDDGCETETGSNALALKPELSLDLPRGHRETQAMVGGPAERLHASGLDEAPELLETPGPDASELVEQRAREREGESESRVTDEEPLEQRRRRFVAERVGARQATPFAFGVEVAVAGSNVEVVVRAQPPRQVGVEGEAEGNHRGAGTARFWRRRARAASLSTSA